MHYAAIPNTLLTDGILAKLTGAEAKILVFFLMEEGNFKLEQPISQRELAAQTGLNRGTVITAIQGLKRKGLISMVMPTSLGNVYKTLVPWG